MPNRTEIKQTLMPIGLFVASYLFFSLAFTLAAKGLGQLSDRPQTNTPAQCSNT